LKGKSKKRPQRLRSRRKWKSLEYWLQSRIWKKSLGPEQASNDWVGTARCEGHGSMLRVVNAHKGIGQRAEEAFRPSTNTTCDTRKRRAKAGTCNTEWRQRENEVEKHWHTKTEGRQSCPCHAFSVHTLESPPDKAKSHIEEGKIRCYGWINFSRLTSRSSIFTRLMLTYSTS